MIRKTIPAAAPKVNAPVDGRMMHAEHRLESILLTLSPGEAMPRHTNPFDVLFIGISGKATLTSSDNAACDINPGETIFVSREEMRGWANPYDEPCQIMVVKILCA